MTRADWAADWDRLPEDPLAFFGLARDFELRELKARYASLLKDFRPDERPAEFERLRAAYESLRARREVVDARLSGVTGEQDGSSCAPPASPARPRAAGGLTRELQRARRGWWRAQPSALAELVRRADRGHEQLDEASLAQLEQLETLLPYAERREQFLRGHPLRAALDQVLTSAPRAGEAGARTQALAAFESLVASPVELLEALPYGEDWNFVWAPFAQGAAELRRRAYRPGRGSFAPLREAREVIDELEAATRRSAWGRLWRHTGGLVSCLLFVSTGGTLVAFGDSSSLFDGAAATLAFLCLRIAARSVVATLWHPLLARRCHRTLWRAALLEAMKSGRASLAELERESRREGREFGGWLASCLREDFAPEHYEQALRALPALRAAAA